MDKKAALGAGLLTGAVAGMIAAHGAGKLGLAGFGTVFFLINPIQPGSSKAIAAVALVAAAASCAAFFRA
jgi:hypothetical protein